MKTSTLVALLKTLPQDMDITISGCPDFYIYLRKEGKHNRMDLHPYKVEDTSTSGSLLVLDSKQVNVQYEKDVNRDDEIDFFLKAAKILGDKL
jgi:hypothetical protein